MAEQLRGVLQFSRGDRKTALATLAGTVAAEARRPPPVARPYPIKPAAELYGELLLAAGDMRGAMAQFQAALKRTPRRPAALMGLASAAFAAGAPQEGAAAAREFLDVWHRADPGRPEAADVRRLLAEAKK
jgi:thioredoxin-like negative regulator of GroEL